MLVATELPSLYRQTSETLCLCHQKLYPQFLLRLLHLLQDRLLDLVALVHPVALLDLYHPLALVGQLDSLVDSMCHYHF